MNIEWFGWLTKGKMNVSTLDVLIMFSELGVVVCVFLTCAAALDWLKRRSKG